MDNQKIKSTGCCEPFEPRLWDKKEVAWQEKKFVKDRVFSLFYIPLNFGAVMARVSKKIEESGAKIVDGLVLSESVSKWKTDLYVAVDREIPRAENVKMSGKFISKVYEGEFKEVGKWMAEQPKSRYVWYTTCPKCAKVYGKNYVVIFREV
jgi:hypothetical protein